MYFLERYIYLYLTVKRLDFFAAIFGLAQSGRSMLTKRDLALGSQRLPFSVGYRDKAPIDDLIAIILLCGVYIRLTLLLLRLENFYTQVTFLLFIVPSLNTPGS